MCVNNCAMEGLPSIALASSPPSGRARRRLSRIVLSRSQESSRASSRRWSGVSDIATPRDEFFMLTKWLFPEFCA
jgi:hypothetical protein